MIALRLSAALPASLLAALSLSACVTTTPTTGSQPETNAVPQTPVVAFAHPSAPRYRLPFEDDPEKLQGLADRQVTEILGEPGFRRRDNPAEMWRYRAAGCILDVFLYRDDEDKGYRVAHAEVRPPVSDPEKMASHCLTSIVDQRNS